MKKIFALILCAMLICATPVVAFADGEETATEVTENTSSEPTVPDKIVSFVKDNFEGTSFVSLTVTIIGYIFYEVKKHRKLDGTMGVLNNNAVSAVKESRNAIENAMEKADAIVENSGVIVQNVLAETAAIAEMVKGYRDEMVASLAEFRKNAEEKQSLEDMLHSVEKTIKTSTMANMELANEVAELLVLANIPPSKKEELYSRHRAAVDAIATVEKTEVVTNDGSET